MSGLLILSSVSLLAGIGLLAETRRHNRRPTLATRLARAEGNPTRTATIASLPAFPTLSAELPSWTTRIADRYRRDLQAAGNTKTLTRLFAHKLLLAVATPLIAVLLYLALSGGRLPSPIWLLLLAIAGSFVPDLLLRAEVRQRREAIFLDLPDAISVLALSLRAGQSLRQALELAARDTPGPLGHELQRALTLARRQHQLDEREALTLISQQAGEPTFTRFSELLAAKESPYLEFLTQQAHQARSEQNRYLERAADRAYLSMHAPLAPLLAVLVLVLAYGFLHFLSQTI